MESLHFRFRGQLCDVSPSPAWQRLAAGARVRLRLRLAEVEDAYKTEAETQHHYRNVVWGAESDLGFGLFHSATFTASQRPSAYEQTNRGDLKGRPYQGPSHFANTPPSS